MIGPRIMAYPIVHELVGITSAFGAEFPNRPIVPVLRVEERDESIKRVPVGALGIGLRRSRTRLEKLLANWPCETQREADGDAQRVTLRRDYIVSYIAEIKSCFKVPRTGACNNLTQ